MGYLIEEYEETVAQNYAIGMKVDETYMGVYEWNRVEPTTENPGLASLTFTNWIPSGPTGKSCVVMSAGLPASNGRWTDVDCNTVSTYYGICEYAPAGQVVPVHVLRRLHLESVFFK